MDRWNIAMKLSFRVLYPYGIYICILSVVSACFQQAGISSIMGVTFVGACLTSFVLWWIYQREHTDSLQIHLKEGMEASIQSICACLFLNVILLKIVQTNTSSETIYASSLLMQILTAGIAVPVVEELLFRGLGFFRLRENMDFFPAALLSSLVFALYHGSFFQGIYAGIMGFLFAKLSEENKGIAAAVIAHISANIIAILMTAFHVDQWILGSMVRVLSMLFVTGGFFWFIRKNKRKS